MGWIAGIDIGGTRVKGVALDASGKILERAMREPTAAAVAERPWAGLAGEVLDDFERALGEPPCRIGVASPGLAAQDGRSVACLPGKLPGLEGLDWGRLWGRDDLVPVLNDAHAALAGEVWLGAARGFRHAVLITLGTGVGGAVYADGRLLTGAIGRAGHVGHISLDVDGAPSIAGMPGSLEGAIGNNTVAQRSGGRFHSTFQMVEAWRAGDAEAGRIWRRSIRHLACGVASLINVLDPEVVIIGGGIAEAGDALFGPLREEMASVEWRPAGRAVPVIPAVLGEWAGAIGAAFQALQANEKPA